MNDKYVLVTGSDGLIGSESVEYFANKGYSVIGIDNNSRQKFFGKDASVLSNRMKLKSQFKNYVHFNIDISSKKVEEIFKIYKNKIKLVIHTAAQPSHDWAASAPLVDFNVNSYGTLNILENYRKYSENATFIFTSTNKVYGDNPNKIKLLEGEKRYYPDSKSEYKEGFNEELSIDNTLHSLFGASKLSADIYVQEYGKYFGLKTGIFRGGCLTGSGHAGTMMHGFLSYLMKCTVSNIPYTIFGYKGKQVRDNIHSMDLVRAFDEFYKNPRIGEVYNIGGGIESNCSMLEAIEICETISGKKLNYSYENKNRIGDHIWYVSDLNKFKTHYPNWKLTYGIEEILHDIYKNNFKKWE